MLVLFQWYGLKSASGIGAQSSNLFVHKHHIAEHIAWFICAIWWDCV